MTWHDHNMAIAGRAQAPALCFEDVFTAKANWRRKKGTCAFETVALKFCLETSIWFKSFSVVWLCFAALFTNGGTSTSLWRTVYPVSFAKEPCLQSYCSYFIYRSRREICEKSWTSSLVPKQQFRLTLCHRLKARSYYRDILWFILYLFQEAPKLKEQL